MRGTFHWRPHISHTLEIWETRFYFVKLLGIILCWKAEGTSAQDLPLQRCVWGGVELQGCGPAPTPAHRTMKTKCY